MGVYNTNEGMMKEKLVLFYFFRHSLISFASGLCYKTILSMYV